MLTMKPVKELLSRIPLLKKRVVRKQLQVASQITDLLSSREWKQRDLSKHTGLKESYVSKVLAGEANMTLETICKFETAFDEDIIVVKKFIDSHRDAKYFSAHSSRVPVTAFVTVTFKDANLIISGANKTHVGEITTPLLAHDGFSAKSHLFANHPKDTLLGIYYGEETKDQGLCWS